MSTESIIQGELLELFDVTSSRSAFATHWRGPAADLEVRVEGAGPLRFPVSKATMRKLRSVARPARYGDGEETLLDRRVRDTWVIAKSRVKLDGRRWRKTLAPALERIHEELALPEGTRLSARLHDLLAYEEGQFFLAHRDAEKTVDMVGTLVVLLPSSFEGGASVISHEGESVICEGSSNRQLTFIAFFADCEHEVEVVEKGHRIALTYELTLSGTPKQQRTAEVAVEPVAALVQAHFDTKVPIGRYRREDTPDAAPDRLVYLLDHQYTPRGLSWHRLKGADQPRAATLRAVAESLDCDVHLATAEVHERWGCEPVFHRRRRWGRGYDEYGYDEHDDDEHDDSEHPPLGELHESSVALGDWRDGDDEPTGQPSSAVQPSELCFSRDSDELTPIRFEHEGYMGNWGDTVDRWYHRAAVVLSPRSRSFLIRAKHDATWAASQLRSELEAGRTELARQSVIDLEPHWPYAVRQDDDLSAEDVLEVALGLDDAELAATWVAPLGLGDVGLPQLLFALVDRYGAAWLDARFEHWGARPRWHAPTPRGAWRLSLPALAAGAPPGAKAQRWLRARLAEEQRLLTAEMASALEVGGPSSIEAELAQLEAPLVALLLAAGTAPAKKVLRAMASDIAKMSAHPISRTWAVPLLANAKLAFDREGVDPARLREAGRRVAAALKKEHTAAPRGASDWSIDVDVACRGRCDLCVTLGEFLTEAQTRSLTWPLAKAKRMHVHRRIDHHELPVRHSTQRAGSPYKLILHKTDALHERDAARRELVEAALGQLETWV